MSWTTQTSKSGNSKYDGGQGWTWTSKENASKDQLKDTGDAACDLTSMS